jgi:Ca2+:H+ antiporter
MTSPTYYGLPRTSVLVPFAAAAVLAGAWGRELGVLALLAVAVALTGAVLTAVHHAEVVAHKVGEPYGTLVLALAVTVIEVVLIVALMLAGGPSTATLARDTVFATVMIVCNGVVGACVLVGALRHGVIPFRVEGTSPALAVLAALATLVLVLPSFTTTTPGPTLAPSQLVFAGVVSLALYGVFVFVQTVRHREYFLPVAGEDDVLHAPAVSGRTAMASVGLLLVCLVAVVGLAKTLAPAIEDTVRDVGAPQAVVGIVIAMLVLLPETWAAVRAAARNHLQTSLNLAIGSALASIGLTVPTLAALSPFFDAPLVLGLPAKEIVLLFLTLIVGVLTLGSGKATVMQGAVHLVLFAVFLFLAVVP